MTDFKEMEGKTGILKPTCEHCSKEQADCQHAIVIRVGLGFFQPMVSHYSLNI